MYAEVVRRIVVVEPPLDWPREVNGVCITVVVLVSVTEPRTVSRGAATFRGQKLSTRALFMQPGDEGQRTYISASLELEIHCCQ